MDMCWGNPSANGLRDPGPGCVWPWVPKVTLALFWPLDSVPVSGSCRGL